MFVSGSVRFSNVPSSKLTWQKSGKSPFLNRKLTSTQSGAPIFQPAIFVYQSVTQKKHPLLGKSLKIIREIPQQNIQSAHSSGKKSVFLSVSLSLSSPMPGVSAGGGGGGGGGGLAPRFGFCSRIERHNLILQPYHQQTKKDREFKIIIHPCLVCSI